MATILETDIVVCNLRNGIVGLRLFPDHIIWVICHAKPNLEFLKTSMQNDQVI